MHNLKSLELVKINKFNKYKISDKGLFFLKLINNFSLTYIYTMSFLEKENLIYFKSRIATTLQLFFSIEKKEYKK